eukprot:scaffold103056_cov16-Tisochrysis_lutea.AAC.1
MPLLKAQRRVRAHCPEQEKSLVRVYAKDVVEEESTADARCERRSVLCRLPLLAALPLFIPFPQPAMAEVAAPQGATSTFAQPDTTITNKVRRSLKSFSHSVRQIQKLFPLLDNSWPYLADLGCIHDVPQVALDISIAPRSFKTPNERTLGDKDAQKLEMCWKEWLVIPAFHLLTCEEAWPTAPAERLLEFGCILPSRILLDYAATCELMFGPHNRMTIQVYRNRSWAT